MLHFVYALIDPRTNDIGYIGLTNDPNGRLQQHLQDTGKTSRRKFQWIQRLLSEQVQPRLIILETVYDGLEAAKRREKYWIQHYLVQQIPLANKQHTRSPSNRETEGFVQEIDLYGKGALICLLEWEVYGDEATRWFQRTVGSWVERNSMIYWFVNQPSEFLPSSFAWASLGILPLEESLIFRLLRGEISRDDIRAEDVLCYEAGHSYTCYIPSVAYKQGKQQHLTQLLQHALVDLYSHGYLIDKLYASAPYDTSETPMQKFIREHLFRAAPDLGQGAWVLSLNDANPSPAIQAYQQTLEAWPKPGADEDLKDQMFGEDWGMGHGAILGGEPD